MLEGTNEDKVNRRKSSNIGQNNANKKKRAGKSNRKKANRYSGSTDFASMNGNKTENINKKTMNIDSKQTNGNKRTENDKSSNTNKKTGNSKSSNVNRKSENGKLSNADKKAENGKSTNTDKKAENSKLTNKNKKPENSKLPDANKNVVNNKKRSSESGKTAGTKKENRALFIFCSIIFLTGVCVLMYPFVSNMVNRRNATQVIDNYKKKMDDMEQEEIDVIKEAAKKYNEQLSNAVTTDDENLDGVTYKDISGIEKVIGYIVVPKIDLNLPIYSGTSQSVLKKGVGHMEQTSYPLGGESTHCVLTGHRGLPDAVLFTDLDKLEIGDEFYLHVLDEVLAYRVDKIKVVEPNESGDLEIVPGEDYCTLVTCTPYAINTHRLLVRGTRVEYVEGGQNNGGTQMQSGSFTKRIVDVWPWLLIAFVVIAGVETLFFIMIMRKRKREKDE